jgi:ferritin-like metal-binding protein YciE
MIDKASDESLQQTLEEHYLLTQEHRRRLEAVAPELGIQLNGVPCYGVAGIVREEIGAIHSMGAGTARDLTIIRCVEKIEHYEIASYAMLISCARIAGEREAADLLERTLSDEEEVERKLIDIVERRVDEAEVGA